MNLPFFPAIAPGFDWTPRLSPRKRPEGEKPNRHRWPGCLVVESDTPAEFKRLVEGDC